MVEILRVMLGDFDETLYEELTLQRLLVVSAQFVSNELTFSQDFVADVSGIDITPDPCDTGTRDDSFINLTCIKAACLTNRGNAWKESANALVTRDIGGITIDTREVFKAKFNLLIQGGWCPTYLEEKLEYQSGQNRVAGAIIMSPFRTQVRYINRGG